MQRAALHYQIALLGDTWAGNAQADQTLLSHARIVRQFQLLVDQVNTAFPRWATVKKFRLIPALLTRENGLLTSTGELNRSAIYQTFAHEIEALYQETTPDNRPAPKLAGQSKWKFFRWPMIQPQ